MYRKLRTSLPLLVVVAIGLLAANSATAAAGPAAVRVGSAAVLPAGTQADGAVAGSQQLELTVALQPRDPAALEGFATSVSTPGSPGFRHYIGVGEFADRFGATAAQIATVRAALEARGLAVEGASPNGLALHLTASAAAAEATFSTPIERVELPSGRIAYANTRPAAVPAAAAPFVQSVIGLEDVAMLRPANRRASLRPSLDSALAPDAPYAPQVATGGPQPCATAGQVQRVEGGGYTADQIASAYGMSSLYGSGDFGAGQTVALLELEPYSPSDIANYQACYKTSASVVNVDVNGGPGAYKGEDIEAALDIEQVIGLAPAANILVYQAPNGYQANVLERMIADDVAKTISTSWGLCETLTPPSLRAHEDALLQEAAAQGQSFFAASGDDGSEDCYGRNHSGALAVDNPASQPYATGVGGSTLTEAEKQPPTEYLWNGGSSEGAGGGGVSAVWAMPSYQSGAAPGLGVLNSLSSGAPCASSECREVPDVSADAAPETGYIIAAEGGWGLVGGTSAAAPLWAALTGLVNATPACRGLPVGFANPALYELGNSGYSTYFNDVSAGRRFPTNDFLFGGREPFPATANYDMATGLGTPITPQLALGLCALAAPTLTVAVANPGTQTSRIGEPVALQIGGSDSGGAALSYSATGLPAGLSINPASGAIAGTPTTAGTSTVTVSAGDRYANGSATQFAWTVAAPEPLTAAALSGLAKHRPKLTFTLQAQPGALLESVKVKLPAGLEPARSPRALKKGTTATVAGAPFAVKAQAKPRAILVHLSPPQAKVTFKLAYPALIATPVLVKKMRHRKVKQLTLSLAVAESTHHTSHYEATVKPS